MEKWPNQDLYSFIPSKNGQNRPPAQMDTTILFYHFLSYNSILQYHLFSCISRLVYTWFVHNSKLLTSKIRMVDKSTLLWCFMGYELSEWLWDIPIELRLNLYLYPGMDPPRFKISEKTLSGNVCESRNPLTWFCSCNGSKEAFIQVSATV